MPKGSISSSNYSNGNCVQTITTDNYKPPSKYSIEKFERSVLNRIESYISEKIIPGYQLPEKAIRGSGLGDIESNTSITAGQLLMFIIGNNDLIFGIFIGKTFDQTPIIKIVGTDAQTNPLSGPPTTHKSYDNAFYLSAGDQLPKFTITSSTTENYIADNNSTVSAMITNGITIYPIRVDYTYNPNPPGDGNILLTINVLYYNPLDSFTITYDLETLNSIVTGVPTAYNFVSVSVTNPFTSSLTLTQVVGKSNSTGKDNGLVAWIDPGTGHSIDIDYNERGYYFIETSSLPASSKSIKMLMSNNYVRQTQKITSPGWQNFSSFFYDDGITDSGNKQYFINYLLRKSFPATSYSQTYTEITDPVLVEKITKLASTYHDIASNAAKFLSESLENEECEDSSKQFEKTAKVTCNSCLEIKFA